MEMEAALMEKNDDLIKKSWPFRDGARLILNPNLPKEMSKA
jgi:hypothetical protein